ncbi:MAG: hypothetical protein KME64_07505 [Scytonematopsis contorta HA4267-MV1]|jgi:hypothetical protein|nr:hypothetical protein [Scytonematopsis contorta HA4267-MV1]
MIQDLNNSPSKIQPPVPLLPRSAWNSQREYLRVLFKVKKALDKIEEG